MFLSAAGGLDKEANALSDRTERVGRFLPLIPNKRIIRVRPCAKNMTQMMLSLDGRADLSDAYGFQFLGI